MRLDRRALLILPSLAALPIAGLAAMRYADANGVVPHLNHHRGIVLRGYDPTAWFEEGRPLRGDARFSARHAGAAWHFRNAAARDRFMADPASLSPAYGGFCAFGLARGYKVDIDPNAWRVHAGRLFLNYDRGVQRQWEADIPRFVAEADGNWPRLSVA